MVKKMVSYSFNKSAVVSHPKYSGYNSWLVVSKYSSYSFNKYGRKDNKHT